METAETRKKLADGIRQLQAKGDTASIDRLVSAYKVKYQKPVTPEVQQQESAGFTAPLREGISGLKTLYGGSEQGIAQKLVTDVKDAAKNIQTGIQTGDSREISKGILKGGARVAGDVATLFGAPIGTVIGATGLGKVFEGAQKRIEEGKGVLGQAIDFLADVPAFQDFAVKHPNAAEDFNRAMNLAFATQETGQIKPKTIIERTSQQISTVPEKINNIRPTAETIATERQAKLNQGFEEQNTRLKSADKSFNKNTITRTTPDGKTETITPIDTFSKYNIAPNIEKGSIQMGDYRTGTGQLGKIKTFVEQIDNEIDTKLENTGQKLSLEALKQEAIKKARSNDDFRQSGTVQSNINKIESRFEDYKQSYGDEIDIAELNNIRKVANKDYSPDTQDVSRVVGDTAREVVYEAVPNQEIRTLLQRQGELLSAKKYAETINGTKVTGGRLGNLALRTTGAVVGSSINSLPVLGPVIGAFGGEFAARALQQSQFKSAWTELRSLFQRSNTNQQSQSANTIPNNAINSKVPFLGQKVKLPTGEAGLSIKAITPELVAKNVDAYELGYIRDYLKTGSLKSFQKLAPLFEGTGIEAMDYKTLNRFLQEVINESTKKLDVKSNPAYTKGEQGRFTGSTKTK